MGGLPTIEDVTTDTAEAESCAGILQEYTRCVIAFDVPSDADRTKVRYLILHIFYLSDIC
jgi:hypothetical protein